MPLTKSANPNTLNSPNGLKAWLLAARPKTWIASISPVLIGTSLATQQARIKPFIFFCTLLFALLIQIGTNYANDCFDFLKGADTAERKGPLRAVQQGWISPSHMWVGTLVAFALALTFALPLMIQAGWWSFLIAISSALFGLLYTGGPKPLAYLGLGELFVLVFFGPVAVCGTYFLQTGSLSFPIFLSGICAGCFSCALLIANNLRDEDTDRIARKHTLVVRFGRNFGIIEYLTCLIIPFFLTLTLTFSGVHPYLSLSCIPFFIMAIFIKKGLIDKNRTASLLPLTSLLFTLYTLIFCLYASRIVPI